MSHNREHRFLLVLVVAVALGGLYLNGAFSSGDAVSGSAVSESSFAEDLTGFAVAPDDSLPTDEQIPETREAMQTRLFQGGTKHALDAACKNNNECESSFCSPRGTCGLKFVGEACTKDEQCVSLFCAGQKCTQPNNVGEKCSRSVACKNGLCSDGTCLSPSEMARREAVAKPKLKRGKTCKLDAECASNQCDRDKDKKKRCLGDKKARDSCSSGWDCQRGLICEAVSSKCMVRPARPATPAPQVEQKQPPAAQTLLTVPANERTKWPDGIRCEQVPAITRGPFAHVYSTAIFVHQHAQKTKTEFGTLDAPLGTTGKLYLFNDKKEKKFSTSATMKSGVSVGSGSDRRGLPPAWFGSNSGAAGIVEIVAGLSNNNFLAVGLFNAPRSGSMIDTNTCKLCKNVAGADDCFKK